MGDSDLDDELALFEKEIEEAANAVDVNADVNLTASVPSSDVKPGQGEDPVASLKNCREDLVSKRPRVSSENPNGSAAIGVASSAVVLAANDAVVVQQPEWQRALQERDAQRMRTKEAQKSSGPVPVYEQASGSGVALGTEATTLASGSGAGGNETASRGPVESAPQLGAWVWDGWQWVWDERASSAQRQWPAADASAGAQQQLQNGVDPSAAQPGVPRESKKSKKHVRAAAGNVWVDRTLEEWPEDDFRVFVGDLAADATDEELREAFGKYASFNMARVIVDKRTGEGKGYGFVSFGKGEDMVSCLKEMNGKYVGSRPVSLKKSDWQKRDLTSDRRRDLKVFRKTGLVKRRKRF